LTRRGVAVAALGPPRLSPPGDGFTEKTGLAQADQLGLRMAIRPSYQLGLDMFEIDDEVMALRSEVWRFLAPLIDGILDRHFAKVVKYTPFYEALIKERGELWRGIIVGGTSRLFLSPFDEAFVADARARVKAEIELGCDM
jgi:hypothetical protein